MRNLLIKWHEHGSAMCSNLKKLFFEHMFTDVSIACEGKLYPAHKFVLSTCSEYFEEICTSIHGSNIVIVLKDVPRKDLEYLLDYMYMGEVDVSEGDLVSFLRTSEFLKLKGLPILWEEERVVQTSNRSSIDTEEIETSSPLKRRKLYKEKQKSIEIRENVSSSRRNSYGANQDCPSPVQQSVQITNSHRMIPPEAPSFPGNVTTTVISTIAESEVIPSSSSPASKRPPLVTIPTTPTFMHFSSPESLTNIKEEIDLRCLSEVCTEGIECMDQVGLEAEMWRTDVYIPSLEKPEKDHFRRICGRNQQENNVKEPRVRTSEGTTITKTSKEANIIVSEPSGRTSEETTKNKSLKKSTKTKASKVDARKGRASKENTSKKEKFNKSTAKNLIRPCHVLLERLAVVEENGVLSWRNSLQTSIKSSRHTTHCRTQRGKENSTQERRWASLNKRTSGTSNHSTKECREEGMNCDGDMAVQEMGTTEIVTEPSKEVNVIRTGAETAEEMKVQEVASHVIDPSYFLFTSMDESNVGAGTSNGLFGSANSVSDISYVDSTTPSAFRVFPCNFCNLTFLEENTRDMHQHMHRGNIVTSACLYCNQAFEASSLQRSHMLLHDGHVAPLHAYLKQMGKRLNWHYVFLHMGHPCVQLKPECRPVVIRTRLELQNLLSLIKLGRLA